MSESYESLPNTTGGPDSRPDANGLPPKTGIDMPPQGSDDSVDPGVGTGDRGQDTGGMIGEG